MPVLSLYVPSSLVYNDSRNVSWNAIALLDKPAVAPGDLQQGPRIMSDRSATSHLSCLPCAFVVLAESRTREIPRNTGLDSYFRGNDGMRVSRIAQEFDNC